MGKDRRKRDRRVTSKAYSSAFIEEDLGYDSGDVSYSSGCDNVVANRNVCYHHSVPGENIPSRSPLTLDIVAVMHSRHKKNKPIKADRVDSNAASKFVTEGTESGKADALQFLQPKPHLVRSKSSSRSLATPPLRRYPSITFATRTKQQRSDHSATGALLAARCIQTLIPARPSMIGPTPQASLPVFSDLCHAAVLVIWSPLRVIPLVNCPVEVARRLQDQIEREMCHDQCANSWLSYWNLSSALNERHYHWTELLEEMLYDRQPPFRWDILKRGCLKAGIVLGRSSDDYSMLKDFVASGESRRFHPAANNGTTSETQDDIICMVCCDEITNPCQLLSCGHVICWDCCTAYLKSAVNSGQGKVKCAAFKCMVEIDIFDAAHILHDDPETYRRLVRFALERSVAGQSRFCPTPNCAKLLRPSSKEASNQPGFNVLLCDCGTSLCRDCETGGPAHPGISCADFSRFLNDSRRMDSELANIKWVLNNSRPCPNCRYPIQRDGGCNHMRCQQCEYYFCFVCGGDGNLCWAFTCMNNQNGLSQNAGYDESGLAKVVGTYHAYRSISAKQATLIQRLRTDVKTSTYEVLELQCNQALLWIHTNSVSRMIASDCKNLEVSSTLQLELILLAIKLRTNMPQTLPKPGQLQKHIAALTLTPTKGPSHRKDKGKLSHDQVENNDDVFVRLFADQELADLCTMDDCHFALKAKEAIQKACQSLLPQAPTSTRRRKHRKQNPMIVDPLNVKQRRPNDPWRNGFQSIDSGDEGSTYSETNNRSEKSKLKWKKGKARVSSRRAIVLETNNL